MERGGGRGRRNLNPSVQNYVVYFLEFQWLIQSIDKYQEKNNKRKERKNNKKKKKIPYSEKFACLDPILRKVDEFNLKLHKNDKYAMINKNMTLCKNDACFRLGMSRILMLFYCFEIIFFGSIKLCEMVLQDNNIVYRSSVYCTIRHVKFSTIYRNID